MMDDQPIEVRGGVKKLWKSESILKGDDRYKEIMIVGPSYTGKTFGCLNYLDAISWKYPDSRSAIVNADYLEMFWNMIPMLKRIVGSQSPVDMRFDIEATKFLKYPNGSQIYLATVGIRDHLFDGEDGWLDFIYIDRADDVGESDWENLKRMRNVSMFGSCNPPREGNFLRSRSDVLFIESHHEDNPELYGIDGALTVMGERKISDLEQLTGKQRDRLYLGIWD